MKLKSLFEQSMLYTIGNVANRVAGFALIPLYTSYLSPEEYGLMALVDLFLSLSVIALGIQSVGGAMIRIFHDHDDAAAKDRVVSTAVLMMLALNLAVILPVLGVAPWLSELIFGLDSTPETVRLIRWAFVAMLPSNLVELLLVHVRLQQNAFFFVRYSLCQLVLTLALNVFFIAYKELGVWGFVYSKLIANGIGAAYLGLRRFSVLRCGFERDAAKRILSFGSPLIVAGVAFFLIHFSDYFFLNRLRSMHDVGLYEFAYRFPFLVTFLVGEPFGRVWSVSLYDLAKNDEWKEQFVRVLAYLVYALTAVGLGVAVFSDEIIEVMARNSSFWAAASFVPLLVLAYCLREVADYFRNILYLNKQSGVVGRVALACAIVNVGLNVMVIPAWGVMGAALCTLVTWGLYLALCLVEQRREHNLQVPWVAFISLVLFSCALWYGSTLVPAESWLVRLGGNSALVLVFFGVTVFATSYFTKHEKAALLAWVAEKRGSTKSTSN